MFGISGEHLLIVAIALLFFGPRRLPELGNSLGRAIKNFKDAIGGVEEASFRKLSETAQADAAALAAAQAKATSAAALQSAAADSTASIVQPSHSAQVENAVRPN